MTILLMKKLKIFLLMVCVLFLGTCFLLRAEALPEVEALLQSRNYAGALEKLVNMPLDQQADGYGPWQRAVALQAAGRLPECVAACEVVPEDSKWFRKKW